jgi:hypothetical protein
MASQQFSDTLDFMLIITLLIIHSTEYNGDRFYELQVFRAQRMAFLVYSMMLYQLLKL